MDVDRIKIFMITKHNCSLRFLSIDFISPYYLPHNAMSLYYDYSIISYRESEHLAIRWLLYRIGRFFISGYMFSVLNVFFITKIDV